VTIKRIHINQHNIRHNAKNPDDLRPVVTVKTSNANHKGYGAMFWGECKLVYSEDKPLSCGAKVWIETTGTVVLDEGNDKHTGIY